MDTASELVMYVRARVTRLELVVAHGWLENGWQMEGSDGMSACQNETEHQPTHCPRQAHAAHDSENCESQQDE